MGRGIQGLHVLARRTVWFLNVGTSKSVRHALDLSEEDILSYLSLIPILRWQKCGLGGWIWVLCKNDTIRLDLDDDAVWNFISDM
jgi:hypothetical protein